jgi:hypothetical protein
MHRFIHLTSVYIPQKHPDNSSNNVSSYDISIIPARPQDFNSAEWYFLILDGLGYT